MLLNWLHSYTHTVCATITKAHIYNNHNKSSVKQKWKNYTEDFLYGTLLGLDLLVFATDSSGWRSFMHNGLNGNAQ